ncbi:f-box domain-containing protein [Moniliophthora roreri MCA 2997]|uniref:F-box domain-containing protein n=1 Tax=Moniliophthora roreri (strain MCA 2997) TaxID=1381753 RepID=V2XWW4_MONRO|nr:f-box domain-containing protein [Moniliophthora roreri MCA 2997]
MQTLLDSITTVPLLHRIPPELSARILSFCEARDLARFSQTCALARELVYGTEDQYIWREVFLNTYDDPRQALRICATDDESSSAVCVNWKSELQKRTQAQLAALRTDDPAEIANERKHSLETFLTVILEALPARNPTPFEPQPQPSLNVMWLDRVLRESRILDASYLRNEARLCARLRSYVGLTHDDGELDEDKEISLGERRTKSRSYVYDLRNYHMENNWGPFMVDGSVNWEHIEHLINVVLMNLRELPGMWMKKPPLGLQVTRAFTAPALRGGEDWAGVEGTWRRYVCFMDYRDLFAFNFSNVASGPRSPTFFDDPRFREATRLIEVKLSLVPRDKLRHLRPHPEPKTHNALYPTLYFAGISRGVTGNESNVEGNVRIGLDGTVRWQFATLYDGATQWTSQGAQIGGIGCASGVVGNWTTSLHDQGDPVGPFWLFKCEEHNAPNLADFT